MALKPSTTARMNLLFLIVLSIIACTSVSTTLATHGEVERDPDTVDAASNGVSIVRNPRHKATMTTSYQPTDFEDRTSGNTVTTSVATTLRYRIARLFRWLQLKYFGKTAEEAFKALKLHTKQDKLLKRGAFVDWVRFVHRKYQSSTGDKIIYTILSHYTDKDLATLLLGALRTPEQRDMAMQTYQNLLLYWEHQGKTSDEVFKLLKLDEIQDASIEDNDYMYIWIDYVRRHTGENAWPDIYAMKIVSLLHLQKESNDERTRAVALAMYQRYTDDFVPLFRTVIS